ncbi:MAG: methylated-DNA--[protein]-cysteine S-methyltransferase [Desulfobacterales bacterium]|nr:MAG: methylated-DNA--[protein]-cysteine S-methyltransferase [Desulfobacterales bacterium]
MKIFITYYQSPIGTIEIVGSREHIVAVNFVDQGQAGNGDLPACVQECVNQIDGYFNAKRTIFSLNLDMQGTDFQKTVWRQLLKVPFGMTASYGEIAAAIGKPSASRAVGRANGKNPISIIVPCHRIIGSDGTLTGYGGGLWRKEWLLNHERSRH